jgi:hypothetical protein
MCICSRITLERLERFHPNLVQIFLYVCMDGVGGLHGIHPQGIPVAAAVTFTQIGIEATAR